MFYLYHLSLELIIIGCDFVFNGRTFYGKSTSDPSDCIRGEEGNVATLLLAEAIPNAEINTFITVIRKIAKTV